MTDDSPSSSTPDRPGDGAPPPPPPPAFEPDRTVMRPREPQPPVGAIHDGDGPDAPGEHAAPVQAAPVQAAGDAPPPGHAAPLAPTDPHATTPQDTAIQPPFPGGFGGEPPAPSAGGADTALPHRATRAGGTGALAAIGAGLAGAAVVISALRSRSDGDLDWSIFGVGIGATAVLLVIALLGALAARKVGGRAREDVVTWPGVVGILGTAVLLNVGIDSSENWMGYLTGAILVVLAAIGYLAARRAAFVVVAILGLVILYALAFDDFVADSISDDHPQVVFAVLVAVFVVAVTLLGWALPSRAVSGVVVGVAGLAGYVGIMASFVLSRYLGEFFGSMIPMGDLGGAGLADGAMAGTFEVSFEEADVWWVLALAAVLTALWALAAAVSNHSGFSILAIAAPATLVPLASVALAVEHPTWWAAALAASGGVLLLGAVALSRLRGKSVAREA